MGSDRQRRSACQGWKWGFLVLAWCTTFAAMQVLAHSTEATASPATPMPGVEALLRQENAELRLQLAAQRQQFEKLMHELLVLKRRLFGRAAEASDQLSLQGQLFGDPIVEVELPAAAEAPPLAKASSQPPVRHPRIGRMVLPPSLPRAEKVLLPEGVLQEDGTLDPGLVKIGEERTERLACTPGEFYVDVIVRPKFARRDEAAANADPAALDASPAVRIAALPRFVVDGGLFHETLLAQVVLAKVDDHLPLHRQSEMLLRDCGVRLPVSTLSDQVLAVGEAFKPLASALLGVLRQRGAMHVDETGLPTQAKGQEGVKKTRAWTFASTAGPNADGHSDPPVICYLYSDDKSGVHVRKQLAGWQGYLHADASNVYDELFRQNPGIREVACWAHARRKFFEVAKASKVRVTAHEAVDRINKLFEIERYCSEQGMSPAERHAHRQAHAVPLVEQFRTWALQQAAQISPASPTGKAFAYLDHHWPAFARYTERGDLKIDNNAAERALRVVALGRKNWMFAGSERGGQAIATLLSLIETAKANGLNPRQWLVDTLTRLPRWPNSRIHELLPLRQSA